jgi:NAD(P)H-nitrite reductase large subunit
MRCREVARSALRNALAAFRQRQLDEIGGEVHLVCTCFGVTEEAIERCGATNVESVGRLTNAGTGCGSCRMLIDEIVGS